MSFKCWITDGYNISDILEAICILHLTDICQHIYICVIIITHCEIVNKKKRKNDWPINFITIVLETSLLGAQKKQRKNLHSLNSRKLFVDYTAMTYTWLFRIELFVLRIDEQILAEPAIEIISKCLIWIILQEYDM